MQNHVIESLVKGKHSADLCEDRLHISDDYIAIIDGATSLVDHGERKRPGRIIAELVDALLHAMEPQLEAPDFFRALSHHVAQGLAPLWHDTDERPTASMLVYSRSRAEIWVLGDGWAGIDDEVQQFSIPYADAYTFLRCGYLHALIASGTTVESLLEHDQAFALISPFIRKQPKIQNRLPPPYGYGVMDGSPNCSQYVRVLPVGQGRQVILASDGYPTIKSSLAASEDYLQALLSRDPLMIHEHPQVKGLRPGQVSFDDRSYIRFTT
ncbi:hypothetical protein [Comamonas sp. GB3 AK4-5]|uniref:hypothetical protein n=1 Tax=Comamonas sp. GB3 AK4-5 TaxID=3231487 RepID=UPI00351EA7BF